MRPEALEVTGTYAEAVAALETWERGALFAAPGGRYTAVYCVDRHPPVMTHEDAMRVAPRLHGRGIVTAFGSLRTGAIRLQGGQS